MERQGSGFKKITETYRAAHNYRDELEPKFYSDASSFQVTLYNLNYGTTATASKVTIEDENVAIEVAIDQLNASKGMIVKAKAVFANMGVYGVFGRLMTPELRKQIAERDHYTCQICGKYMPDGVGLHIDHIIPVSKGGKTVPSNLQVLCSKCNGHKSDQISL